MINEVLAHIHPIIVHFPIVIILLAALYDLFFAILHKKAAPKGNWVWLAAFLSAWIAIGTGPGHDARGNTDIFHYHDNLATLTTFLAFFILAYRVFFRIKSKAMVRQWLAISTILSVLCAAGILSVGYFGGKMVYDQGVGVKVHGKYVNPPKNHNKDH
ncbi:DUF2231 domain-containing protein [Actinomycetes bacterium NPDC127524]